MVDPRIAQFLAQRGGLVAEALGEGAVRATHERRAEERGVPLDRYPDLLASDPREAAQFLEDLKKHPKLGRFNWQMPTPDMKNKIASFKIQGKLEGG